MNLFFQTRRPRGFHHRSLYADERGELLTRLERHARAELGMPYPVSDDEVPSHSFARRRARPEAMPRGGARNALLAVLLVLAVILLAIFL